MRLDIYIHMAADPAQAATLVSILRAVRQLSEKVDNMAGELTTLTTEVSEATTVMDSAVILVNGLAQQLRDAIAANDPAALAALSASLDASANALALAVTANTPAAPAAAAASRGRN